MSGGEAVGGISRSDSDAGVKEKKQREREGFDRLADPAKFRR